MKHHTAITALTIAGLFIAAAGTLVAIDLSQYMPPHTRGAGGTAFETEKQFIAAYIGDALAIHADYKAQKITGTEAKKRALSLKVPAVLKERHLQWILSIDAGRDEVIEDMMAEYRLVQAAQ